MVFFVVNEDTIDSQIAEINEAFTFVKFYPGVYKEKIFFILNSKSDPKKIADDMIEQQPLPSKNDSDEWKHGGNGV
jgi:hypothetical protein